MPARCTVTIDGTKIDAVSASVRFSTLKDRAGRPELGSLASSIVVAIDFHDEEACPHATLKKLFNMSKEPTKENINKDMKIEFWKDDSKQDALCSYQFKGWISRFETKNPMPTETPGSGASSDVSPYSTINHLLILELEPGLNPENFKAINMSN